MLTPRSFKLKRHTRRVLICKRGLPVFAFLLASLMLSWPAFFAEHKEQFSMAVKSDKKYIGAKVDMEQVRFYARDKKNQPLTVTAPKVLETDSEKQIVTLYKPQALYEMSSGTKVTANTSHGLVYQLEDYMLFEDEVVATTDTGYKAVSTGVICENKTGVIRGDKPITINGPTGNLKAIGFRMYNKGDNIDFFNKTDTTVISEKGKVRVRSSDGLFVDQKLQTLTAVKDVVITQEDKTIKGDKVVLTYNTKEQDAQNRVREIEAFGHVEVQNPTHRVTGGHGVYNPKTATIVMTEDVVLYHGNSHLAGEKATLNLNTGESQLIPKKQTEKTSPSGRVRGRLNPADFKGDKK